MQKIYDKVIEILKEKTEKEVVKLDFTEGKTKLTESKLSGIPFIPINGSWPIDKDGNKLNFMLQINFEEMPKLKDYPKSGLLQIFISEEGGYGVDFDNPQNQDQWRIVYYENISSPMDVEKIKELAPVLNEEFLLPFDKNKEYKIEFRKEKQIPYADTLEFNKIFTEYIKKELPKKYQVDSFFDLPEDIIDKFYSSNKTSSQISGYPAFTQCDIRENFSNYEDYILLVQLDSDFEIEKEIMRWGDMGIANFFIKLDDLKNKDFSKVVYNWDCY